MDKNGKDELTKDEVKKCLQKADKETCTDELGEALQKDADKADDGNIAASKLLAWIEKIESGENVDVEKKEEDKKE